ncbi:MAG: hypothetical protein FVQ85_03585 [Planctomycetes bacterium]|nr:hypothetical protein [Planctomycetota bacterium]
MKFYKRYYIGKILVYVSLWAFLITGHSYEALADNPSGNALRIIPNDEMPIVLDLIGNQVRNNYERIITWSGEIDVKLNKVYTGVAAEEVFIFTDGQGETPEAILQKVEEKITFAFDANKNFVYIDNFREKPSRYFNYITGTDLGNSGSHPYWSTITARPDFLLKVTPQSLDRKENRIIRRKAVKRPSPRKESRTGLYEGIISDPRRMFMPGGGYTWDHLGILIKKINRYGKIEFDGYTLQMEERIKGEIIEYKIIEPSVVSLERSDPNHYIIIAKIFSSQCGFNMIYWEVTTGGGIPLQKFTWEYELINGVFLPKRVVTKHYGSSGEVALEKESTYVNNKLNQTISPETFEYTNLKLKEGDIFIDEILNKEYRYKAATRTLEPVEK